MAEFKRVKHAELPPTKCVTCGDHAGPFVDLGVKVPVYGHLFLCAETEARPGCVQQIARQDNMVNRKDLDKAEKYIAELHEHIHNLQDRLRGEKLVRLVDVMPFIGSGNRE